jgi:hypothetical protein
LRFFNLKIKVNIKFICAVLTACAVLSACGSGETKPQNGDAGDDERAAARTETTAPPFIDFSNGNFAFLSVYEASPDAGSPTLSLIDYKDGKAVRLKMEDDKTPYLVIDASSILGEAVSELYMMEVTVGVENEDGEFEAVSGKILAYSGADRIENGYPWSVYIESKNPNTAKAVLESDAEKFVPDAYNFFILVKKVDNALSAGKKPSNLIISEIRFLDKDGVEIAVNHDAVLSVPEGFGKIDRSNLIDTDNDVLIAELQGSSSGWGQAAEAASAKNGGSADAELLVPGSIVTVYYSSANPPELILQSWTEGSPEGSGWAKVAPFAVNDSGGIAQYSYEDMAAAFGTGDFVAYLDKIYIGDTGAELELYNVTIGAAKQR